MLKNISCLNLVLHQGQRCDLLFSRPLRTHTKVSALIYKIDFRKRRSGSGRGNPRLSGQLDTAFSGVIIAKKKTGPYQNHAYSTVAHDESQERSFWRDTNSRCFRRQRRNSRGRQMRKPAPVSASLTLRGIICQRAGFTVFLRINLCPKNNRFASRRSDLPPQDQSV